jgi:aldehyde dehydrogenase (NAD+)
VGTSAAFNPDAVIFPRGCWIEGRYELGDDDEIEVIRPSDGKWVKTERGASDVLVDKAVLSAARAFRSSGWSTLGPGKRAKVLHAWADLVDAHREHLAQLESVVSTRLVQDAKHRDVALSVALIRYYAESLDKLHDQVHPTDPSVLSITLREAHGVVAAIAPWNAPLLLAMAKLAPALAAGNSVVLKPSELTPYSALELASLAHRAGLPSGCLNVLIGYGNTTGAKLVKHPQVDYVSFTGSTVSGARVMADAAASGPKPVALELGGKSPHVVLADAPNLDHVADMIATHVNRNAGQVCSAGTRLVVERRIAEKLIEKVVDRLRLARPGPTWSSTATLGPIISAKQAQRIEDILGRGQSSGAQIIEGGTRVESTGNGVFFRPTVAVGMTPENAIVAEEIFGPVLAVQVFDDFEQALLLADHTTYGLSAAIHTANLDRALCAARHIQAGTVWVNTYGLSEVAAPFGGYKKSGFGKEFGLAGLEKYYRHKHIRMQLGAHSVLGNR